MITKIRHRIRCFIYIGGKVFVIMALPARAAARIKRRTAPTGVSGPLTN
jgi:hypothetical protein